MNLFLVFPINLLSSLTAWQINNFFLLELYVPVPFGLSFYEIKLCKHRFNTLVLEELNTCEDLCYALREEEGGGEDHINNL